jgi:hypothetical protein
MIRISVYTVLFPSGKTLTFSVYSAAEIWITAYRGVLISSPVEKPVVFNPVLM